MSFAPPGSEVLINENIEAALITHAVEKNSNNKVILFNCAFSAALNTNLEI